MSKLREILIHDTKHISSYEPYMENVIVNLDRVEAAIKAYIMDIIGEDEENYRPYLVASRKLGIEENQKQARLIATCINRLRAEQRSMLE